MEIYNCERKGKLQDYMQNYSPHHRGTSEAHKFISFQLFSVLLNKVFTCSLHIPSLPIWIPFNYCLCTMF